MTGQEHIDLIEFRALVLRRLDDQDRAIGGIGRTVEGIERGVQPVIDFYTTGSSLLRWLKWSLGLAASAAAIVGALHVAGQV